MAKRPLGLGKSVRLKKQKKSSSSATPELIDKLPQQQEEKPNVSQTESDEQELQLTVELDDFVDPNDDLSQLKGLWITYLNSSRENELMLNGIIHECDRLLRNNNTEEVSSSSSNTKENNVKLNDEFYSIYSIALSELAKFQTQLVDIDTEGETKHEKGEEEQESKSGEYFDAAIERAQSGLTHFPGSKLLQIAESQISLNRIMLEQIGHMDLDSVLEPNNLGKELSKLVNENLSRLDGINIVVEDDDGDKTLLLVLVRSMLEFLKTFDDFIDIVRNFGREKLEGLDSDDEEVEEEEVEEEEIEDGGMVELSKKHPLYSVQKQTEKYMDWLRNQLESLHELISKTTSKNVSKNELNSEISGMLGKSYLQLLERPELIYTTLKYNDDEEENDDDDDDDDDDEKKGDEDKDDEKIDGLDVEEARKLAMSFFNKLIPLLKQLMVESKPETLVDLAELEISMGNLYEIGSDEQEEFYRSAEVKLRKLNNITHGKYQDILDTITKEEDEEEE